MSIKLMTLAWELTLDPTDKLVLLALADWADDTYHSCWPAVPTIARKTNVTERTVYRCLDSLETKGLIERRATAGKSTRYRLNVTPDKLSPLTQSQETPDTVSPKPSVTVKPSEAKASSGSRAKPKLTFEQSFPNETVIHAFRVTCVGWAAKELSWSPGNAGAEYARFVTNAQAHDRRYANWEKAWQNWCRSDYCKTKPGNAGDSLLNPGGVTMKDLIGG